MTSPAITLPLSERPRVSILIPSAANIHFLLNCLLSLQRHAPARLPFETIVVLNEADPESMQMLERVAGIRVESSTQNLGLAGGANRARWLAHGELLILLHDDAEIEPGWMEALVETADAYPEAGAVGGMVLDMDGSLQNAGMVLWSDGSTSPPWVTRPDATEFEHLRAVDYCGTSSLLVRAATWDAIGGLDELFYPVYYVDVDLAMAIRARGQVVLYEPASRIRHHRGASGDRRWQLFLTERNRQRFVAKWKAQLSRHEPPAGGSEQAIVRAVERARSSHAQAAESWRAPFVRPVKREITREEHDLRHMQLDLALQKDYVAALSEELDLLQGPWWRRLRGVRRSS